MGGGGSSSSQANTTTRTSAWDNRAAGTDDAVVASGGANVNVERLDAGAVEAGTNVANNAIAANLDGFKSYASLIAEALDTVSGTTEEVTQSAQNFAVQARMDAQTTQLTKAIPWVAMAVIVWAMFNGRG